MFTVFVLGNIASGKSTACRYFESRGAMLIDLDELAKSLYVPGSDIVNTLADEFGWDILDEEGGIRRGILASRAFASPDSVARLNGIVHPVLIEQLSLRILDPVCCTVSSPRYRFAVVEVSAPTGFEDAFGLADEVLVIAPLCQFVASALFNVAWSHLISMPVLLVSPMSLRCAISLQR